MYVMISQFHLNIFPFMCMYPSSESLSRLLVALSVPQYISLSFCSSLRLSHFYKFLDAYASLWLGLLVRLSFCPSICPSHPVWVLPRALSVGSACQLGLPVGWVCLLVGSACQSGLPVSWVCLKSCSVCQLPCTCQVFVRSAVTVHMPSF